MTPESFRELVLNSFSYLMREGFILQESQTSPWEITFVHSFCTISLFYQTKTGDWVMAIKPVHGPYFEKVTPGKLYQYILKPEVDVAGTLGKGPEPRLPPEESLPEWARKFAEVSRDAAAFFDPTVYEQNLGQFAAYHEARSREFERQLQIWEQSH